MPNFTFQDSIISYCNFSLPLTLEEGISLYNLKFDINFEFGYSEDLLEDNNIKIYFDINNFNQEIKEQVIYEGGVFNSTHSFRDLIYINNEKKSIDINYKFVISNFTTGSISLLKFNYVIRDFITGKYYNSYSEPVFMYSYNTSVKGFIENQDKNAIHIYLNEKYKNILIVVNENIPFNNDWKSLNNIDLFNENYGLYYSKTNESYFYELFPMSDSKILEFNNTSGNENKKININKFNPNNIVANNFIKSLNNINDAITFDTNIHYHYIDVDGNHASTIMTYFKNSTFNTNLPNWLDKFPPFLIKATTNDTLFLYKTPYLVEKNDAPSKNIKDQYIVHKDGKILSDYLTNELFSTKKTTTPVDKKDGYKYKINRYSGYYEPLTRNIPLFTPTYYWIDEDGLKSYKGNYRFNTDLEDFGVIKEVMYSKVNENEYILKLKDVSELSLYPILDEVGLSQTKRNIFSSPWDKDYYLRTTNQFILSNNSYNDITTVDDVENNAQIQNVKVISGISNYNKGINIYGRNEDNSNTIDISFDIYNYSSEIKTFNYIIKYQSSQKTDIIKTDVVNGISANGMNTVNLTTIPRPSESTSSLNYEEFTKWYLIIEIYGTDGTLYDFDNSILFNVYNNIIDFKFNDMIGSNGFYENGNQFSTYYVENEYSFGVKLTETFNKLKNVKYIVDLYLERGQDNGNYDKIQTYTNYINKTTNNSDILFDNVIIPISLLGYNQNENRKIKFEVNHYYQIENESKSSSNMIEKEINVSRTQEVPIINYLNIPNLIFNSGTCFEGKYTGDVVKTGIQLVNTGGEFVGTVKIIFSLRENGITIITKSITRELSLAKGGNSDDLFMNVELGPLKPNDETFISYTYKTYDVKVSTSYISGYVHSDYVDGLNESTPICS